MSSLSGRELSKGKPLPLALWRYEANQALTGCGSRDLLGRELTAFFASRQCPGAAIRAAMDWALQQARAKRAVVSGFHSPLEQSVLKVLMAAGSPTVVVLARPVEGAKLLPEWAEPLAKGQMAVVSAIATAGRLTEQRATERNAQVAQLAQKWVVAYASPGGSLGEQLKQWRLAGDQIDELWASQLLT